MRPLLILLPLAALTSPAFAQSADKPLGDILESIEEATQPAPPPGPVESAPVPPDGIGTTPLPPSRLDAPFGPPTPAPALEAEAVLDAAPAGESESVVALKSPELTEAERQTLWEAAERARLEALDRARAERQAASRRAWEAAEAEYQRQLAEREAAMAEAQAQYQADLERIRLQAERERLAWEARVRACREGDREACAQPGDF